MQVRVCYKNRQDKVVAIREYPQTDYVEMIRTDLFRTISDIENLFYRLNGGKPKKEWSRKDITEFDAMKHRLLDKAGAISRLPECLIAEKDAKDGEIAGSLINAQVERG